MLSSTISSFVSNVLSRVVLRAVSRRASKYMIVPDIRDDASTTPSTTDDKRRQLAKLRLITSCQTLATRIKVLVDWNTIFDGRFKINLPLYV